MQITESKKSTKKHKIKQVIVVEGKTDTNHLKKLFDVETIETNGSAVSKSTLNLIKQVAKTRGVILFLDPDYTGNLIRKKIAQHLEQFDEAFIIKDSWNTKKIGVNEASDEEIIDALNNVIKFENTNNETISYPEYDSLELHTYNDRYKLCKKLNIPYCNHKQLFKKLNMLKITYEELKEKMNEK